MEQMPCILCGNAFNSYEQLLLHDCGYEINDVQPQLGYNCRKCAAVFNNNSERDEHERRGHVGAVSSQNGQKVIFIIVI